MEMEMEEDMEVEVFTAHEVDIDYEFDAAKFFDFSRAETPAEASRAELWFQSAKSYPPSPVVARMMLGGDILLGNVNTSPKTKHVENTNGVGCNISVGQESCAMDVNSRECGGTSKGIFGNLQGGLNQPHGAGLTFGHSKGQINSSVKPSFLRKSTLMKPTASQLAKQNRTLHIGGSRFQKPHIQTSEKSLCSSSGVETQATKRQKLEGGHLHKVTTEAMPQTDFIHKAPKKVKTFDKTSTHAKLKITIPIEPDFETTYRAQRIRPKNGSVLEQVPSAPRKFKARLLNKKIFEAPSLPLPKRSIPKLPEFQEFHLKTMERAMQNTSTVPSTSLHLNGPDKVLDKPSASTMAGNGNGEPRRPSKLDGPKQDGSDVISKFKARPLNKKIFSSKGDIGVFWNNKRETTVPVEFNFQTEKRTQHLPPSDLFSKLSLTSELQPDNGSRLKLPQPASVSMKDSKENRANNFQPENKIMAKEKPSLFGGKQARFGGARPISDADKQLEDEEFGSPLKVKNITIHEI